LPITTYSFKLHGLSLDLEAVT